METRVELKVEDRCDRCGAQAFLAAWKPEGALELLFCVHHGREALPALELQGWTVLDQTAKLTGEVAGVSSVV